MNFEEWVITRTPARAVIRVSITKRLHAREANDFTAMLISGACDDPARPMLGGLWIQVMGARILDSKIWASSQEEMWPKLLSASLYSNSADPDWLAKEEHIFSITREHSAGHITRPLPLGNLLVVEKLTLLQGIVMRLFGSSRPVENRLLNNMAHQLDGARKQANHQLYAGIL